MVGAVDKLQAANSSSFPLHMTLAMYGSSDSDSVFKSIKSSIKESGYPAIFSRQ